MRKHFNKSVTKRRKQRQCAAHSTSDGLPVAKKVIAISKDVTRINRISNVREPSERQVLDGYVDVSLALSFAIAAILILRSTMK